MARMGNYGLGGTETAPPKLASGIVVLMNSARFAEPESSAMSYMQGELGKLLTCPQSQPLMLLGHPARPLDVIEFRQYREKGDQIYFQPLSKQFNYQQPTT
jgi:hypothetical protein